MALKTEYKIRCGCKASFKTPVYEYILADFNPELRDAILSGDFNVVMCPSCGRVLSIEVPYLYRDEKNRLFIWVCSQKDKSRRKKLEKELLEKKSNLECHFLDGVDPGKEMLIFGREELVSLLLATDPELKKREGKHLLKNFAARLIPPDKNAPGCLALRGDKVRVAVPLAFPPGDDPALKGNEAREKWLKNYCMGVNIHNPYSSLLNPGMKKKWDKARLSEPLRNAGDEFEDFACSWARFKTDPKGFRESFPERRRFFDSLKGMEIPRKVRSLRIG